jgi:beta-RFAP synthase
MIRVRASSRLHFGLLKVPSASDALPNERFFGGAGLMIEDPGIDLTVAPAEEWSAVGQGAERALAFARQVAHALPGATPQPLRILLRHCAPEHQGLGTGTQLGLAVARAVTAFHEANLSAVELAHLVGRGKRSAVGIHGFAAGGFLVEAGKRATEGIAPLALRLAFPEAWRIVLVLPPLTAGLHGAAERAAFDEIHCARWDDSLTDRLCRLLVLSLIPALKEGDCEEFGEALHEFNARAGEPFAALQGGTYSHSLVAELIASLRREGVHGVGQSSWGPAVFAVLPDADDADRVAGKLRKEFALPSNRVVTTKACNHGASSGSGFQ